MERREIFHRLLKNYTNLCCKLNYDRIQSRYTRYVTVKLYERRGKIALVVVGVPLHTLHTLHRMAKEPARRGDFQLHNNAVLRKQAGPREAVCVPVSRLSQFTI